jgi:hypothetical protein
MEANRLETTLTVSSSDIGKEIGPALYDLSIRVMDISVSRLNQRMALQLPAELPLGLVFVVGQVQLPSGTTAPGAGRPGEFYLCDQNYRLPCRMSERAAAEFRLADGDKVRAGGHLVFEPALASYYLQARDIERLDGFRPAAKPLAAIIADNSRREQAVSLTPAELPPWVQQMAPPELRPQPDQSPQPARRPAGPGGPGPQLGGDWELLADAEAAVAYPEAEPALAGMSDELIAFLSQAMDSQVEVEITPEIMDDLNTSGRTERLSAEVLEALDLFEASVGRTGQESSAEQPGAGAEGDQWPDHEGPTGLEQTDDATLLSEQEPAGEGITVAEFSQAVERAMVAEQERESATETPTPKAKPAASSRRAARAGKSNDVIPWYVALLIILVVVIVLAALVYFALFPDSLPIDLPLGLLRQLGLPN